MADFYFFGTLGTIGLTHSILRAIHFFFAPSVEGVQLDF